jgi:hypothetical protein
VGLTDGTIIVLATADDGVDGLTAVGVVAGAPIVSNLGGLGDVQSPKLLRVPAEPAGLALVPLDRPD